MARLLIVVDYQNDFVDGALGFSGAELLGPRIAEKINDYRAAGDAVAFTFDTHQPDYLSTQEGRNLPVEHCVEGTPGHALHASIAECIQEGDPCFFKPTFGSVEMADWLRSRQAPFSSIELVGLVSNICVLSNAVMAKAACPEVPVIVDAACTASHDPALHEAALDILEGIQVQVINR